MMQKQHNDAQTGLAVRNHATHLVHRLAAQDEVKDAVSSALGKYTPVATHNVDTLPESVGFWVQISLRPHMSGLETISVKIADVGQVLGHLGGMVGNVWNANLSFFLTILPSRSDTEMHAYFFLLRSRSGQ